MPGGLNAPASHGHLGHHFSFKTKHIHHPNTHEARAELCGQRLAQQGRADPRIDEFAWLLQELRVSLFAQELKTPVIVSVKRLEKMLAGLRVYTAQGHC